MLRTAVPLFYVLLIFNFKMAKQQQGSKICISLGKQIQTTMTLAIQVDVSALIRDRTLNVRRHFHHGL